MAKVQPPAPVRDFPIRTREDYIRAGDVLAEVHRRLDC
jgi:hypothetical protein